MASSFTKIENNTYKLQRQGGMKADVVVYANQKILSSLGEDLSLQQLQQASMLPKVVSPVIGMPDIHQGFGLPIGGVMATEGLISVGAVGMDINCGVRILTSPLPYDEKFSQDKIYQLITLIEKLIPLGLGGKHKRSIDLDLKLITTRGVEYLKELGYATDNDIDHTEENGQMEGANFECLSEHAKERAVKELGTLGSGNHFIDILKIENVFEPQTAQKWGLFENQVCVMIHSGSRALGHQTCLDYTNLFWNLRDKYHIFVPQKGLAALPIDTKEGNDYFAAMSACVNFAFANRQLMTHFVRQAFTKLFGVNLNLLYDVAHNIAKWEQHQGKKLLVHRKGATRALPAAHPQNPKTYLTTGHPAIVPGSMGTSSYIMVGLPKNSQTFHSINHGAGRLMSRSQAKRTIKKEDFEKMMTGIIHNKPLPLITDEAPQAYKDIEEIVAILVGAGLTKKIASLKPLAVISGV
jgi:tRNA-splicing ligase RtcB